MNPFPSPRLCRLVRYLASRVALPALAATAQAASVAVTDLRCEYLREPLAIETHAPRLGWKLTPTDPAAHGQRQRAWQVQVATTRTLLEAGRGDLWDSGWVTSDQSQLIGYAGRPLVTELVCFWRVRVKDEHGQASAWSAPASWTVGMLAPGDWTAQWIGTDQQFKRQPGWPPPDNTMPDPWLRKTFALAAAPRRALLQVASVGYHEVYVNGRRIGDSVLMPCISDFTKRARYVTYDITRLLRPGTNALGLWLGTSWSIFPPFRTADKPAGPIVLAQADLEFADGAKMRVVTDASWRWHPSPNTTIGVWDFMHYGGESFDANRDVPGWGAADFDDAAWQPVSVFQPKLLLSAQPVEPNRCVKEIRPVAITEPKPGVWRVDMGVNFAGWIEVQVAGQPGDRIEFQFSERAEEAMTHRLHSFYVIGPSGRGTFRNRFNYAVGRWIQIEGLRQKPELSELRGWLVRTDYEPTTTFRCSDPLLNRIHDTVVWTWETLSLGGYSVDCAQRERMGYGGDAHATTETALDHFRLGAFYTKWSEDWRDVQGQAATWGARPPPGAAGAARTIEPGNLPYTAPTYWGGGGPGWSGYCVTLPWEMYRRYGDRRILETNFVTIERWLAFLDTHTTNNLLARWGGEWDFLGDWLWPGAEGVNGNTRETLFFNNCYRIYNLQTAARIADVLGRTAPAAAWRARAEAARAAVHREFYDPARHSYVNGSQAYLALALLAGVPPAELCSAVTHRLQDEILVTRQGHFWAGITGGSFVIKELLAAERPDLVFNMARQEDYPGWGWMLKNGATTMWEDWEGKLSLCHSSYLHIGAWFVEGLAGIRPGTDGKGYQHFELKPAVWPGCPLEEVECRFDSPYGQIQSNWNRAGGNLHFAFAVPPNATATLFLPADHATAVRHNGRALSPQQVIRRVHETGQLKLVVPLEAGRHAFDVITTPNQR
ncbi:MAG: family 78 glycoside hydrolase catalytic domain [Verrucomicrobiota bacterium]|jgi:alpha-L-rhamnosidase